jgi:hypothetical protein
MRYFTGLVTNSSISFATKVLLYENNEYSELRLVLTMHNEQIHITHDLTRLV